MNGWIWVALYLGICALVGFFAIHRARRFWFWFVFSFILTPLLGFFWLLLIPSHKRMETYKIRKMLEEQQATLTLTNRVR
jgi:hypothetical protein